MTRANCNIIIFSSSATVYGEPQYLPYDELHPTNPVNPYGRNKLMVEEIINDWVSANKLNNGTMLRYFNPVGAHASGQIGEEPDGVPNNLMPFIAQVAVGRQKYLSIYGNDYETIDGTGARDYIHVVDLAVAHVKALSNRQNLKKFEVINIGRGEGVTVLELIKHFERASNTIIKFEIVGRRKGDLAEFWADSILASELIDWIPKLSVEAMCRDTWNWQKNNPDGYK
jgi:UDP-glucose 4-epimerase